MNYHRLENYFKNSDSLEKTIIEYQGDAFHIKYENGTLSITETQNRIYSLPQIMYIPAERNFISYVKSPKELKLSSDSLKEFLTEFENAKNDIKGFVKLPINDVDIEYDKLNNIVNIKGKEYKVRLTESSSGFQSLVPLYIVSRYLANSVKLRSEKGKDPMSSEELSRFKKEFENILSNKNLTDEQRRAAVSVLSSKFNKTAFINIVEEPEQNLFPSSQWQMLKGLAEFNNLSEGNKLVMTTHSPYIINYLSLMVKAFDLKSKAKSIELNEKLKAIVPLESTVSSDDLRIYEFDEKSGTIKLLNNYKGLPSDENYLNFGLADSNELFANLLDIEDLCQ